MKTANSTAARDAEARAAFEETALAIVDLDKDLTLAARAMKEAAKPERPNWQRLINGLLDRRSELSRRLKDL